MLFTATVSACGRGSESAPAEPSHGGGAGSGQGGGGGSRDDLRPVAAVLDGYVMKQPCLTESGPRACRTHPEGACPVDQEPTLVGAKPTRETLTFGGRPGTLYDVTLRVQGVVESKVYENGSDVSDLPTNGFYRAGTVDNAKNQRSVFALRVTSPTANYFFNALGREAMRKSVFAVDYEATLTIHGGTALELWISDPNCQALKNCGDPDVASECKPVDIPNLDPKIKSTLGTDPISYNGQFLGLAVRSVVARN